MYGTSPASRLSPGSLLIPGNHRTPCSVFPGDACLQAYVSTLCGLSQSLRSPSQQQERACHWFRGKLVVHRTQSDFLFSF